jgi:hypothetical protein
VPAAAQPGQPAGPPVMPGPPQMPASERARLAAQRRGESDYIFSYWPALGWTILTFGIYGLYVFYQLVRRMRDHNARRLELLDAATTVAWEQAGRQGLQQELALSFQRAQAQLAALRQMTRDFREPVIWVVLAIVARGIAEIIAFVFLDQDLIRHDQAEAGVEDELSQIYGRLGHQLPPPGQGRVKGPDSYVSRIVATVFSFGIYMFWLVLQPDARAEQALHHQLGSGGRAGEGRGGGQLRPAARRFDAATRIRKICGNSRISSRRRRPDSRPVSDPTARSSEPGSYREQGAGSATPPAATATTLKPAFSNHLHHRPIQVRQHG